MTRCSRPRLTGKLVSALGLGRHQGGLALPRGSGHQEQRQAAAQSDGAKLMMANGHKVTVNVKKSGDIFLRDRVRGVENPQVVVTDINQGNKQIAHAINRVLLPVLPS